MNLTELYIDDDLSFISKKAVSFSINTKRDYPVYGIGSSQPIMRFRSEEREINIKLKMLTAKEIKLLNRYISNRKFVECLTLESHEGSIYIEGCYIDHLRAPFETFSEQFELQITFRQMRAISRDKYEHC